MNDLGELMLLYPCSPLTITIFRIAYTAAMLNNPNGAITLGPIEIHARFLIFSSHPPTPPSVRTGSPQIRAWPPLFRRSRIVIARHRTSFRGLHDLVHTSPSGCHARSSTSNDRLYRQFLPPQSFCLCHRTTRRRRYRRAHMSVQTSSSPFGSLVFGNKEDDIAKNFIRFIR